MIHIKTGRSFSIPVIITIIAVMFSVLFADEKTELKKKSDAQFLRIYNMGTHAHEDMEGWISPLTHEELVDWSKTRNIKVREDQPPVKDNMAWFTSKYGSKLKATGFKMHRDYFLWLNFVTFTSPGDAQIPATLEISADGELIKRMNFNDLAAENQLVRVRIPRKATVDGEVTFMFMEYSGAGGFFGIWDMILTDDIDFPVNIQKETEKKKDTQLKLKESPDELLQPAE